jgi:hypothetical protein
MSHSRYKYFRSVSIPLGKTEQRHKSRFPSYDISLQPLRGGCPFCCYWWNYWLSLFKLSFHKSTWTLQKIMLNGIICIINILDVQLLVQSVSITTKVVSSNPGYVEVYSIQQCVIKFVSALREVWKHLSIEPCQRHIFKWCTCIFYILAICKYGTLGLRFLRLTHFPQYFSYIDAVSFTVHHSDCYYLIIPRKDLYKLSFHKSTWTLQKIMLNGIICIINILDVQLLVQSVSISKCPLLNTYVFYEPFTIQVFPICQYPSW